MKGGTMKVFISWSGERSKAVAVALRQWLPDVIQSVDPWVSAEDIEAGARWSTNIADELSETRFGVICLTQDNQTAPWILFEAGALAKTIENTFVVPYLIDLGPADIQRGPLNQFQAKRANKTETWELVRTLNRRLESPLLENQIERTFEKWWPDLEKSLEDIPQAGTEKKGKRSTDDMLEEILELVRQMARSPQVVTPDPVNITKPYKEMTLGDLLGVGPEKFLSSRTLKSFVSLAQNIEQARQERDNKGES
jgi:hypothetical protein